MPSPFRSPLTFVSPMAPDMTHRAYIPIFTVPPPKVGVGMDWQYLNCAHPLMVGATWYYNWDARPPACPGVEAVPMIWSAAFNEPIQVLPVDIPYLLMFNECDGAEQCNTAPKLAAMTWHRYERMYPNTKLVGPNVSQWGLAWLLDWHAAYIRLYGKAPRIWALGVHCYNPADWCRDWINQNIGLAQHWTQSGKVWVTEWAIPACLHPDPGADAWAIEQSDELMQWMLGNSNVEREAWFVAQYTDRPCNTDLIGADGELTAFGKWYRSAPIRQGE